MINSVFCYCVVTYKVMDESSMVKTASVHATLGLMRYFAYAAGILARDAFIEQIVANLP